MLCQLILVQDYLTGLQNILKVVSILGEHRKRGKDTPDKVSEKIMCV